MFPKLELSVIFLVGFFLSFPLIAAEKTQKGCPPFSLTVYMGEDTKIQKTFPGCVGKWNSEHEYFETIPLDPATETAPWICDLEATPTGKGTSRVNLSCSIDSVTLTSKKFSPEASTGITCGKNTNNETELRLNIVRTDPKKPSHRVIVVKCGD